MKIARDRLVGEVVRRLRDYPVVGILGARQVGKTTLAHDVARLRKGPSEIFDLENPDVVARLAEPMRVLEERRGLLILDEVQRRPELFPVLRVLADRPRRPARFLILGSASPELLRQSSESLAGRISYMETGGFALDEVGPGHLDRLWLRGGFPLSYLARSDAASVEWRRALVQTHLERDLPQLGVRIPSATLRRFWAMLAHWHGGVWNSSEFARAFGVADHSVRHYLDVLTSTFVARRLAPWHENLGKRQVKAPKVYLADSGVLHSLIGVTTRQDLMQHPRVGASWEGFVIGALAARLGARPEECFFWRTHTGAELDLLVVRGRKRLGFEIKHTRAPAVSRSMLTSAKDLKLDRLDLVHAGSDTFPLPHDIRAVAAGRILQDIAPL